MKPILLFLIPLLFSSCFINKPQAINKHGNKMSSQDLVSNYKLFAYVNSLTEKDYYTQFESIKKADSTDFFTLRMAYTKTKDYFPYDSQIGDSLKKALAFINALKFPKAIALLNSIQAKNYVNIPSHLYLGYCYKELGDTLKSEYHHKIYNGLLNSIYRSGDGKLSRTAYIVISTNEEYHFLNWFGLEFNGQSLKSDDGLSFDLIRAIDPKTKKEYELYFNIDLLLSSIKMY